MSAGFFNPDPKIASSRMNPLIRSSSINTVTLGVCLSVSLYSPYKPVIARHGIFPVMKVNLQCVWDKTTYVSIENLTVLATSGSVIVYLIATVLTISITLWKKNFNQLIFVGTLQPPVLFSEAFPITSWSSLLTLLQSNFLRWWKTFEKVNLLIGTDFVTQRMIYVVHVWRQTLQYWKYFLEVNSSRKRSRCQSHQHITSCFLVLKFFLPAFLYLWLRFVFFVERILAQKLLVKYWWSWFLAVNFINILWTAVSVQKCYVKLFCTYT